MIGWRNLAIRAAGAALALTLSLPAHAEYPDRPVKIIIAFPPGSALDALTRLVGGELSNVWGQPVIIENISGGVGNIGTDRFSRSEPDGYTLLSSPPGPLIFNNLLFKDTRYDATSFEPISVMAKLPNVLLVRKDFPARDPVEFVDLAKKNPGKFTYASQGVTSTGFLTAKLFETRTGASMTHVPYRGAGPALSDIAAGQVDMMFDVIMTSAPLHKGGVAKIIGVAGEERSPALPDIPTFAEAALPGFQSYSWFALAAPARAPSAIVEKISRDVQAIVHRSDFSAKLRGMMYQPVGDASAEMEAFLRGETKTWSDLIATLHLEPQ